MGEMIKCIPDSIPAFKCDAMYLVVDKLFETINYGGIKSMELSEISGYERNLPSSGYSDELTLIFSYENGICTECRKSINGLFPLFETDEKGANFLFLPLHLRDKCIGYFAVRNAIYLMEMQFLFSIMNSLITGIEQLYARTKLAVMNETLSMLYHHDAMTLFYNRSGYADYAENFYAKLKNEGKSMAVIYYDLDKLKYINDNYGHEEGDRAIKLTAQIIGRHTSEKAMCFRLGGDEFLVLDEFICEQELKDRISRVSKELHTEGTEHGIKVGLSVSAGYTIAEPSSAETLEAFVNRADDLMYDSKKAKRLSRA